MKKILFILCIMNSALCININAQGWVKNVMKKSIAAVTAFDKEKNKIAEGTAFFVDEKGGAVADYAVFKGAYSAEITDAKGKKYQVSRILGADATYSLVKFKVDVKKSVPLEIAKSIAVGAGVYAVKFDAKPLDTYPRTSVSAVSPLDEGNVYYTLTDSLSKEYVGSPLMNEAGQLIGVVQPSVSGNGYAIGSQFVENLRMKAIVSKSSSLAVNNIHIPKALPDTMEEALVFLYMKSAGMDNDEYMQMLNEFISRYPQNAEGYIRRARGWMEQQNYSEAERDMKKFVDMSTDKGTANAEVADAIYSKLVYQPLPVYDKWSFPVVKEYIDKALAEHPERTDYKLLRANTLTAMNDFEGAIAEIDSALALFPTPLPKQASQFVMRRAQLYEQVERYRDAVKDYNTYLYLENQQVSDEFFYNRAVVEFKSRMYQQCLDDLDKAIERNPREPLYKETRTKIREALGL